MRNAEGLGATFLFLGGQIEDLAVGVGDAEPDAGDVDFAGGGATGGVEVGDGTDGDFSYFDSVGDVVDVFD